MIPKIIHYCWFGRGEKPKLAQKCIASWKKFCPDYEIIEWNEDNFDVNRNGYTRICYEQKKYAFLSDYARLLVVAEHGGIYFDTDVELLRCPDEYLKYDAFFGFENDDFINTGLGFGAIANHPTIVAMLRPYLKMELDEKDGFHPIGCPALNTQVLVSLGLETNGQRQNVAGAEILPSEYMNPYDDPTGRMYQTQNTMSIHWYSKSALGKQQIIRSKLARPLHRIFGKDFFRRKR